MKTIDILEINRRLNQIEESMITKQELEKFIETIAILSNENTMNQIRNSEEDISKGKFRIINSIKEL
ncbi:MAG TPA: hypothetical protein ENG87_02405 [Candidatus Pacearchaeota archaeon]|nr:hypothetical protein BMS3Abin17_00766 [archaeon BMS3Abin17]HDK42207.1 hypothetical protein [Candidatus Pacearchaeota archaeon]HDZ61500.1 hypothetical protein [Candidatus Pacearchaeota archaeon]